MENSPSPNQRRNGNTTAPSDDQLSKCENSQVALGVKNPPANAGCQGSIPGSGRSPGKGNGKTLQYFCQENLMDRRAWWAILPGVAELDTTEHILLSGYFYLQFIYNVVFFK